MLAMRLAITSAMINITAKVTRYCTSAMAKVNRGGTKKKSKAATFSSDVSSDGPRPSLKPAIVTPSRYSMTRFESSNRGYSMKAMAVHTAVVNTAHAYRSHRIGVGGPFTPAAELGLRRGVV